MEFFDTKWTRYFQLACSLLGFETNQLLFSVSASYSSFTWASRPPPADKFPLFSRVKAGGSGGILKQLLCKTA